MIYLVRGAQGYASTPSTCFLETGTGLFDYYHHPPPHLASTLPNCVLGVLDIPALLILYIFFKRKIDREKENNNKVEQVKSVFTRRRRRGTTAAEQVGSVLMGPFHHDVAKIVNKFSTHGQAQSGVMVLAWLQGGRKVTQVGRSLRLEGCWKFGRLVRSEGWS